VAGMDVEAGLINGDDSSRVQLMAVGTEIMSCCQNVVCVKRTCVCAFARELRGHDSPTGSNTTKAQLQLLFHCGDQWLHGVKWVAV
jgi:hypothetical protein